MPLRVLTALDTARTQYYHFKAIIIAGMGLFTDAYDLFCIPPVMTLIGRVYYYVPENSGDGKHGGSAAPAAVEFTIMTVALLGTALGQLTFGVLGDRFGRRRVYGIALVIMVLSAFGCGFSVCRRRSCVLGSLFFFRFLLGVGIGGDYPLSATIMSEFANKRTRGAFIAAVFSMQGLGILASSAVTMAVCAVSEKLAGGGRGASSRSTVLEADLAWRLILMIGAIPAGITFYWRMMMPETARYTALVEQNAVQAAKDMERIMDIEVELANNALDDSQQHPLNPPRHQTTLLPAPPPTSSRYPIISRQFLRLHGRHLFGCAAAWLLVDVVFYSSNLFLGRISEHRHPRHRATSAFREAYEVAKFQAIVAASSTIPGYWACVGLIDRVGRVKLQMLGFAALSVIWFFLGSTYSILWADLSEHDSRWRFLFLFALTFFFSNFGPNTTTFIVPAELFPARFRTTCHGVAGSSGKAGAMIGVAGLSWVSRGDPEKDTGLRTAVFVVLGVICVAGAVVTYFFTPETKGRSLEENEIETAEDAQNNGHHLHFVVA